MSPGVSCEGRAGAVKGEIKVGNITGLAWNPDGTEIWFSEADPGGQSTISAAGVGQAPRIVWRGSGFVILDDVAPNGAVLADFVQTEAGVLVQQADRPAAVDLGWLDGSVAVDISPAGDALLINERAAAGGAFYVRKLDGSPAVRMGAGAATSWSRDGRFILARPDSSTFVLTPVGPGSSLKLTHPNIFAVFGWFLPDGTILLNGREGAGRWRFFLMDATGRIRPVGPDGLDHWIGQQVPSDDGKLMAAFPSGQNMIGQPLVYPLDGSAAIPTAGFNPTEAIVRFMPDSQYVLVYDRDRLPVRLYALNYRTGQRTLWREFASADPTGLAGVRSIAMAPGGRVVAYNYVRSLSTLYLIEGLR
jgi:hypothetical protein